MTTTTERRRYRPSEGRMREKNGDVRNHLNRHNHHHQQPWMPCTALHKKFSGKHAIGGLWMKMEYELCLLLLRNNNNKITDNNNAVVVVVVRVGGKMTAASTRWMTIQPFIVYDQ
jgi:hypothetical protein